MRPPIAVKWWARWRTEDQNRQRQRDRRCGDEDVAEIVMTAACLLLLFAARGDGAALGLALLLGHLRPTLALAAVLALAGGVGALAAALALASVDALAVDLAGRAGGRHSRR